MAEIGLFRNLGLDRKAELPPSGVHVAIWGNTAYESG